MIYRGAVRLDEAFDPVALFEELFESNGGAIRGATFTIVFTITRAFTRCWHRARSRQGAGGLKGRTTA